MRSSNWSSNHTNNNNEAFNSSSSSSFRPPIPPRDDDVVHTQSNPNRSNVTHLLARREVAPRTRQSSRKIWGQVSNSNSDCAGLNSEAARDARSGLTSWVESESFQHLSAKYCELHPPPRSTIAAAFSPNGKLLASTHGDHTVKIIDCETGKCLKVLNGHRRTPWVVRFHPLCPGILASGSLDQEVRLWDANAAVCIGSSDFYRPIASLAFHALGELLAIASGHKLYIWNYNRKGENSSPTIILETRRSLRAVHFHPHGAPFLLTAEVNELDSSDSLMTTATSRGYLHYPPPTVYVADARFGYRSVSMDELPIASLPFLIWPSITRGDGIPLLETETNVSTDPSTSVRLLTYSTPSGQYELLLSHVETSSSPEQEPQSDSLPEEAGGNFNQPTIDGMDIDVQTESSAQVFPFGNPAYWEIPFLQGWLIGQSQAGQQTMRLDSLSASSDADNRATAIPSGMPIGYNQSQVTGSSDTRQRSSRSQTEPASLSREESAMNNIPPDEGSSQPSVSRIQSEIAASLAAAASAELPCTVKLRIWPHDIKNPYARLRAERCRLTIPHAVLCSEMGAHFSPCGRFLAACVACALPNIESDPGFHGQMHHDNLGAATSPTRHPISAHRLIYELRIYSLEEATFGTVLASRAIRAAHCLTSIQFSPASEHLLLAYGRRHTSLLKSVVIDGETTVPIYTILEVYRVSDMELVRVLPSAEDEVNVACFHPSVGGGLVYGTKEGKLRILKYDPSYGPNFMASLFPDDDILEGELAA